MKYMHLSLCCLLSFSVLLCCFLSFSLSIFSAPVHQQNISWKLLRYRGRGHEGSSVVGPLLWRFQIFSAAHGCTCCDFSNYEYYLLRSHVPIPRLCSYSSAAHPGFLPLFPVWKFAFIAYQLINSVHIWMRGLGFSLTSLCLPLTQDLQ